MGGLLHVEVPDFEESAKKFIKASLDEQFYACAPYAWFLRSAMGVAQRFLV